MIKLQKFPVPSSLTLHYHVGSNGSDAKILSNENQSIQRERSLSPDSLEQRLLQQQFIPDDADDEESLLTSSSSMMDSISIEQSTRPSHSTKTIFKTLTSQSFLNAFSLTNGNKSGDDHEDDDDDLDDDSNEIQFNQDDVNLLFSDTDDGAMGRFSNESFNIDDDDYDDDDDDDSMSAEYASHVRPLSINGSSDPFFSSSLVFPEPEIQYSSYHFLDPISEAASEEERRAAISILRQQQKHKYSTSSSLSISVNGHCDGDTTLNDDLSTLSDIDEQDISIDENSISQSFSISKDQHIHKKRCYQQPNSSTNWIVKMDRKLFCHESIVEINPNETRLSIRSLIDIFD